MKVSIHQNKPMQHRLICPKCDYVLPPEFGQPMNLYYTILQEDLSTLLEMVTKNIPEPEVQDTDWVSAEEAAKMIGIGKTHFQKLKNEGCFEVSGMGKKLHRIRRASVLAYIESHKIDY